MNRRASQQPRRAENGHKALKSGYFTPKAEIDALKNAF